VAHACNPSYSEGRDQEDHGSRPAQANSLRDPILKNPTQKGAGVLAQVVEYLSSKYEHLSSNPCVGSEDLRQMSEYPIPQWRAL
jgi:hypothetical protein